MELATSTVIPHDTTVEDSRYPMRYISTTEGLLAVALGDATLHVFSAVDGKHILKLADPSNGLIWAHGFCSKNTIVAGSLDGRLSAWAVPDGHLLWQFSSLTTPGTFEDGRDVRGIRHLEILPEHDDRPAAVLTAERNGTIRLWSTDPPGHKHAFLGGHKSVVTTIRPFQQGRKFVSSSRDGVTAAWCVETADKIWTNTQDGAVFACAVVEETVVLGRQDGLLKVLSLEDGTQLFSHEGHTKPPSLINGLLLGKGFIVSTAVDGHAKVWSLDITRGSKEPPVKDVELYDHAITDYCMVDRWLLTIGKNGGPREDCCGMDQRCRLWNFAGTDDNHVKEIALPPTIYMGVQSLDTSPKSAALLLMRRGEPCLQLWRESQT